MRRSGKREGKLMIKVTKRDVVGGVTAKKSDATHVKNEILRVACLLKDAFNADLFSLSFMSVFVGDVISF